MEKNRDLFKEAIADARAVKEVSIANAKAALEEVITPRLKSMFEKKLTEMEEEEEKQEESYKMKKESSEIEEEFNLEELLAELDEVEDEEVEAVHEAEETEEETMEEEITEEEDAEEAEDESEEEEEEESKVDDMEVEIDFDNMTEEDLRAFIEEVVDEMIEAEELELTDEPEEDEEVEIEDDAEMEDEVEMADEIAGLELEEEAEETVYETDEMLSEANREALETIETLRKELNEVNLLNSKLLYLNKILKEATLKESQKVKVISAFDKAETVKEVKLVFETLKENLSKAPAKENTKKLVRESRNFASSTITGTSPVKKPVMEVDPMIMRMKKLAGLL
jgi:hypothetical protein